MNHKKSSSVLQQNIFLLSLAGFSCLAASAPAMSVPSAAPAQASQQCLTNLKAFSAEMKQGGYWLDEGGYGYGYGYPMYGYGYGFGYAYSPGGAVPPMGEEGAESKDYWRARPGYEVRTLLASAQILAESGQEKACETVLTVTRDTYAAYTADLKAGKVPRGDVSGWRRQQIETAKPVSGNGVAYRSDSLIGTTVVNAQDDSLGSVEDIVMSPRTGEIAYLVIGHGGFIGLDEKYVPVPWNDFKSTVGSNLLVLSVTKSGFAGAPQVDEKQFAPHGDFAAESRSVDAYWAVHLTK
jgi:sporulation protein YlmC with PRC-barrel domain